jgi:hypothetical protein
LIRYREDEVLFCLLSNHRRALLCSVMSWLKQTVCQLARSMNSGRCGILLSRARVAVGSYPTPAAGIPIQRPFPQ